MGALATPGLFAERFALAPERGDARTWEYDEAKDYNVKTDGRPYVAFSVGATTTNTQTFVRAEPADSDGSAWEGPIAGVGTRTTARRDTDRG